MLIALYSNHHHLPFWSNRGKPYALFSEDFFEDKKPWSEPQKDEETGEVTQKILTKENSMSVFLLGLQAVRADHLMAHVSAFCNTCAAGAYYHHPHRAWVQVSTRPEKSLHTSNRPLSNIINGMYNLKNDVLVEHVWGGDNGTYSPFEYIKDEGLRKRAESEPLLWKRFFIEKLDLDHDLKQAEDRVASLIRQQVHAKEDLSKIKIFAD